MSDFPGNVAGKQSKFKGFKFRTRHMYTEMSAGSRRSRERKR